MGAECIQIFTRPPGMWRARGFSDEEAQRFRHRRAEAGGIPVLAHDIYLTNLAAPDGELRERSIQTLAEERARCSALGVDALVCHMGAHLGAGVEAGLRRYAAGLREVLARTLDATTRILLENAAGQGTCLGCRFADIGQVLRMAEAPEQLGVCVDTCHAFAAGYDLRSAAGYAAMWDEFAREVGMQHLRAMHLNDSKKPLDCRVDRHEHIGQGCIGLDAFRLLCNDARLAEIPMVIETYEPDRMHKVNLKLLKSLRA